MTIIEGARYGILDINLIMSMTKAEFDRVIVGIKLGIQDEKDRAIMQAQMITYAVFGKKQNWSRTFGDTNDARLAILHGEEFVNETKVNEALLNQALSDKINSVDMTDTFKEL